MVCPEWVINHPELSFSSFNESMASASATHSLVLLLTASSNLSRSGDASWHVVPTPVLA